MKRCIAILLLLTLLFTLISCAAKPVITEVPAPEEIPTPTPEEQPEEISLPTPEPFPGKIAIITNGIFGSEEEYRSAMHMVGKYGEDKIIHDIWPVKYPEEREKMIGIVQQIAEDPEVKALIINPAVQNTLAAVDKLLEIRDDMFLVAIYPTENPPDVAARFNLVLYDMDGIMMGDAMPVQAQKLGAKTLVHLSFPRHMSYPLISARYEMLEENCKILGIELISHFVPDPTGDIGMAGAEQFIRDEIPKLVAKYGQNTAFFCTNCGLQVPLIYSVVNAHAIYIQPCCPSPFHGFPLALGLKSEGESVFDAAGKQDAMKYIVDMTIEKLAEKNMLGRVSTWPVPVSMLNTVAATEYVIKWINGEVPKDGIDTAVLEQCMADYAGVKCYVRSLGTHEADSYVTEGAYDNWLFVTMDYLTYGKAEDNIQKPAQTPPPIINPPPNGEMWIENGVLIEYRGHDKKIVIPAEITAIANWAFWGCENLQSITIPEGVVSIGGYAFYGCSNLSSVDILGSLTAINSGTFANCSKLKKAIIPATVTSIGDRAFVGCSSLSTIEIPAAVTSIGRSAFWDCSGLESITIPDSMTSIRWSMFTGCTNLQYIIIPASVTSIESDSFPYPPVTIYCTEGSAAEQFAKENDIHYVIE